MKYTILLFLMLQFAMSCSNAENKRAPNNLDSVSVNVKIYDIDYRADCGGRIFMKDSINQYNVYIDEDDWAMLEKNFQKKANTDNHIWDIVLYVDHFLEEGETISSEDIEGYQVYFLSDDNELHHRLYVKNINDFDNFEYFNCETTGIFSNASVFFIDHILNSDSRKGPGYSIVNIFSNYIDNNKRNVPMNTFLMDLIEDYKFENDIE